MRDMQGRGIEVDAMVGRPVSAEICKAWCAEALARRPDLKGSLKRFAAAATGRGGAIVRKRSDYKYSRVGVTYGPGGTIQTTDPVDLYAVQIGGTDTVLGQLSEVDTNVISAGKQTNNELFKAHAIGFTLQLLDLGAGVAPAITQSDVADLWRALLENTQATLTIGTQSQQRFPSLGALPGIAPGFQSGGTVTTAAATQGRQSLITLKPEIVLPAGESYGIRLNIKRRTSTGIDLIPQGAQYVDFKFAISCVMYGTSYTGIPG